jgi:hypothetical protein
MTWTPQYNSWYCHRCRRYERAVTQQQTPSCPICRQPALFYSHAYRRWYCNNCKTYPEWKVPFSQEKKEIEKTEEKIEAGETVIEDLFLLYNDGRLIKHYTRRLKPTVDSAILSSMLAAVQDFVKESLTSGEEGNLEEIKIGKMRIFLQKGRYISIAIMIEGEDKEGIESQVKTALWKVETDHEDMLKEWDGDIAAMKPLNDTMTDLLSGKFK